MADLATIQGFRIAGIHYDPGLFGAPTAHPLISAGQRPGNWSFQIIRGALKGRNSACDGGMVWSRRMQSARRIAGSRVEPFRARQCLIPKFPGRCPGLMSACAFGAAMRR